MWFSFCLLVVPSSRSKSHYWPSTGNRSSDMFCSSKSSIDITTTTKKMTTKKKPSTSHRRVHAHALEGTSGTLPVQTGIYVSLLWKPRQNRHLRQYRVGVLRKGSRFGEGLQFATAQDSTAPASLQKQGCSGSPSCVASRWRKPRPTRVFGLVSQIDALDIVLWSKRSL